MKTKKKQQASLPKAGGLRREIAGRKQAEQELKESEQRFKTVFDNNNDGLLVSDIEDKKFLFGNPIISRMLGYGEDELPNLTVADIHPVEDLAYVLAQFEKQAKKEVAVAESIPVKRKDGSVFYADINSAPITLGGRKCLMGAFRDVTVRKQVEEAVRKLNEELEQKVRERTEQLLAAQGELVRTEKLAILGQLAGSVGHELRNPLGVINNAVYFLKSVLPQDNETVKEYLDIIKSEVDISGRIISDLLDFSRTKTPQAYPASISEIVKRSLHSCAIPEIITVEADLSDTLPPVNVDAVQMGQVFQNLILNAVQAMQKGGSLHISAKVVSDCGSRSADAQKRPEPSALEISITDTGEGISPENFKKLFHPLFTTKVRGIGLGLVVTKRNVEANNGRLSVESREGEGSTFRILLPIEEAVV